MVHEVERTRVHMGLKEPTELEERIEYFEKYLENDREYFARARKTVLSDPFPPDLRLVFEQSMDRVDELLAQLGHKALPREKYRHVLSYRKHHVIIRVVQVTGLL